MSMIQFHFLRNYAPSNLNRDETGAPKSAVFAGVQRGRISSQCLKRVWRSSPSFEALDSMGIRTKFLPELILGEIKKSGNDQLYEFAKKHIKEFTKLGKSEKKQEKEKEKEKKSESETFETKQMMFFSKEDIQVCVKAIIDADFNEKNLKDNIDKLDKDSAVRPITLDIALFGRMITDNKFADVEASLQVAHALSTNRVNQESDYFTAVDDLGHIFRKDAGAAHLDNTDFNSCCYYEYAALDIDQLKRNLKDSPDALSKLPELISVLLDAMIYSCPTGKQNSFAAHSLPSVICLELKDKKIPISYINAFEEPVRENYSQKSAQKLFQEINKIDEKFDTAVVSRLWFDVNGGASPAKADVVTSINEIKKLTADWLK